MMIRRPLILPPEEVDGITGAILDRAIERARVTNEQVALAIGYSASGEKHVRDMRAGAKAFTLTHYVRAISACPRLARALVAEMGAVIEPDADAPPAVRATQEAALAGAELARVGVTATMDGVIDEEERRTLRVQSSRVRKALDTLDAALAKSDSTARGVS